MDAREYIENAKRRAIGGSVNSTGRAGNSKRGFLHATGNSAIISNTARWNRADGSGVNTNTSMPTSQPFILSIVNASAGAVSNFNVWGAFKYLYPNAGWTWNANGDLVIGSVTISSYISSVSYQSILQSLQTNPVTIGQTNIVVSVGSQAQSQTPVNLLLTQPSGEVNTTPLIYKISDNQFQTNQTTSTQPFKLTDRVTYQLPVVEGLANFLLYFYPAGDVNLANALTGNSVTGAFSNSQTNLQSIKLV